MGQGSEKLLTANNFRNVSGVAEGFFCRRIEIGSDGPTISAFFEVISINTLYFVGGIN